jgi:hypothetical protein
MSVNSMNSVIQGLLSGVLDWRGKLRPDFSAFAGFCLTRLEPVAAGGRAGAL